MWRAVALFAPYECPSGNQKPQLRTLPDDRHETTADNAAVVFEAMTPCDPLTKPLRQIPDGVACEMTMWRITFAADRTFVLNAAYGMSQPNTTGIRDGGTKVDMTGAWSTSVGTNSDPHASVIALTDERDAAHSILFVKINDDLLHLLDPQKRLMVGNGGWSYTLNRIGLATARSPFAGTTSIAAPPSDATATPFETAGVYEGRTPCSEITNEFTKVPSGPQCQRIKWRLRVNADSGSATSGTYEFDGTETGRDGTWRLARGTRTHPSAMVLELDLGDSARFRLLHADANNLYVLDRDGELMVGDALLSYTLSRRAT